MDINNERGYFKKTKNLPLLSAYDLVVFLYLLKKPSYSFNLLIREVIVRITNSVSLL